MLARIAHELFWVGRYLARAEHTARVLDGVFGASLQTRRTGDRGSELDWEAVMASMGVSGDGEARPTAGEAVRTLTVEEESASVRACVDRARQGARRVRDVVSREMWQALNTLYLELDEADLPSALQVGPRTVFSFVRERCALWWGLAEQTMLRDQAHAFLFAGRHLEEGSMMLRSLRVAVAPLAAGGDESGAEDAPAFELLRAVGGLAAYRRSAEEITGRAESPASFLLFERRYPHSVAAGLDMAHDHLLDADAGYTSSAAVLRLVRLRAELEFNRGGTAESGFQPERARSLLAHVQTEFERVDSEIEARYFGASGMTPVVVST
jgi:uncharacterized alpha-E superfamily protein